MIREHLPRWIYASVAKFVKENANGWPVYVENIDELRINASKYIELRIDGPYLYPQGSKGEYRAEVEVNIFMAWQRNQANVYEFQTMAGHLSKLLLQDICVYKLGKESVDDKSLFSESLKIRTEEGCQYSNLGPAENTQDKFEGVIETHYMMTFDDPE